MKFPNVPNLPGIPPIPRLPGARAVASAITGAAVGSVYRFLAVDRFSWGIFFAGTTNNAFDDAALGAILSVIAESVGVGKTLSTWGVDFQKETQVVSAPIERGSFASYNKVEAPSSPVVTLALSGWESDRKEFLDTLELHCASMQLFDIVTPEKVYINHAIERYRYRREARQGAQLLMVELMLKEIRQVSSRFSKSAGTPKQAEASGQADAGTVRPQTPPASSNGIVSKKLNLPIT